MRGADATPPCSLGAGVPESRSALGASRCSFFFPFGPGLCHPGRARCSSKASPVWVMQGGNLPMSKPRRVGAFLGQNVHRALQPAGGRQLPCPSASSSCWRRAQGDVGAWRGAGTAPNWPHPHSLLLQGTCTAWQCASWHSIQPGHRPAAVFLCHKCGTGQNKLHGVSFLESQDRRGGRTELGMSHGGHTGQRCRAGAPHGASRHVSKGQAGAHAQPVVSVCAWQMQARPRWWGLAHAGVKPHETHAECEGACGVRRVPRLCASTPSCSAAVSARR